MINWVSIAKSITQSVGRPFSIVGIETLSGGCINTAFRISDDRQYFFIKLRDLSKCAMFVAESTGLHTINATKTLSAPKPICFGYPVDEIRLGRQLAQMHQHSSSSFGWVQNNALGSALQPNQPYDDWMSFWREQRLSFS